MSSTSDLPLPVLPDVELAFHFDEDDANVPVTRNDVVHLDASKFTRTPQGGLRGPAAVSRVGVFMYKHTQGPKAGQIVREFRPAEEVFHPDSLLTLDQAPITNNHPNSPETKGFLTENNTTALSKGQITNIHHDETHVLSDAVIQDGPLVKAILAGKMSDFSPGYVAKMDWTPGIWNGQPYDVVQRDIRYNHVAILPRNKGRQGPSVALRFDAAILEETPMIVHFDGKDFDLADEAQRAAYHAALSAKTALEATRADKAQAKADALEAELAPLKAAAAAAERATLEVAARKVCADKDVKFDGLTDRQVREKAIGVDCAGKSDEYVAARFDQLLETPVVAPPAPDKALEAARAAMLPVNHGTQNAAPPDALTERYKQPLTASKDRK